MDTETARKAALELMSQHGLLQKGWRFAWDRAKRRHGCCHSKQKMITLSISLAAINEEETIRDTLLHEIAHALVGVSEGHGPTWKRKAMEIGCSAQRCARDVNTLPSRLVAKCVRCGRVFGRERTPKRKNWCRCIPRYEMNDATVLKWRRRLT